MTNVSRRHALAFGIAAVVSLELPAARAAAVSEDEVATAYAKVRALVRDDYLSGRVAVVDGWIMSQQEAVGLQQDRD